MLAAACEDGSVRLFDISGDSLRYTRSLPTQPQRACSVAFHADGLELAAGYADGTIRRWNCKSGNVVYRLTIEAQDSTQPGSKPVVWALLVLQDWTIVCVLRGTERPPPPPPPPHYFPYHLSCLSFSLS